MWLPVACGLRQLCFAGDRQSWDLGRFVKTVTYFNEPPSAEQVLQALVEQPAKLVRQLTGQDEVPLSFDTLTFCAYSILCCQLRRPTYPASTSFCVQEKQSAVLKLLAANGAPAPTSSGNVVVVAGEMRSAFLFMQHATLSAKTSQIKVAAVGLVG